MAKTAKRKYTLPQILLLAVLLIATALYRYYYGGEQIISLEDIPEYSGEAYVAINGNQPFFTEADDTTVSYETYSPLDGLGRCGVAEANVGQDLMPTEARGNISSVKPTGWHSSKYDFVDGKSLYNRCHLIGYQLTAENANKQNLITGTRYLNVIGMLPFENMVADYVHETNNHVLYRVTPIFDGADLVARGVLMEAWSVEDEGDGVCFNVYCYNVQPGVVIDYATGDSTPADSAEDDNAEVQTYVANTSSGKFHLESCPQAGKIKPENRETFTTTRSQMLAWNYVPAGCCNP